MHRIKHPGLAIVFAVAALALLALWPPILQVSSADKLLRVEDDTPVFAISSNNRVAYVVRHLSSHGKYYIEHDDVWISTLDGKKTRLVNGQKYNKTSTPFSYAIRSITWSPDSHHLAVDMETSVLTKNGAHVKDGHAAALLDDSSHELTLEGMRAVSIDGASHAAWLSAGTIVAFLTSDERGSSQWQIHTVRPPSKPTEAFFHGQVFRDVVWDAQRDAAFAVESSDTATVPLKLVRLNLLDQKSRVVAGIRSYAGGLSLSPSRMRAAFYLDPEDIEVLPLASPGKPVSVHVPFGKFQWSPDETALLLKRGDPRKSGVIFWIKISDGRMEPILHGLVYRDFQISPDGRYLGVMDPGRYGFQIIPLPSPVW